MIPIEIPKIGYSMGAINILPTITAELLVKSPNVAMSTEKITIKNKSRLGTLLLNKFSIASVFSLFDTLLNIC